MIDTSAWIEFLRDTASPACEEVDWLLAEEIATCDPIRLEVLAGAGAESHLRQLRGLLARAVVLPAGPADYEAAAAPYRICRRRGETVRKMIDCLIDAIAIREDAAVLHSDSEFDVLARHTSLAIHTSVP